MFPGPFSCFTREATSTRPEGTASRAGGFLPLSAYFSRFQFIRSPSVVVELETGAL